MTQEKEEQIRKEAERLYPYAMEEVAEIWPKTAEMLKALVDHQRAAYIAGRTAGQREIEALTKERDQLREENRWIPVSQLPAHTNKVQVLMHGYIPEHGWYSRQYEAWVTEKNDLDGGGDYTVRLDNVTHWKQIVLPSPPEPTKP